MPDTVKLGALLDDSRGAVDAVVAASTADRGDRVVVDKALALVGDEVQHGIAKACDQDLGELLVSGWAKASELKTYADPVKYPPTTIARMVLGEHAQKIVIDPELTLTIDRLPIHNLKLLVEFTATLKAAVLLIQAGAITGFELGSVVLAAKLRWGDVALPLKLKQREITLPGRFTVLPPRPIKA